MLFDFEERLSDSPFVERVWRALSERAGTFASVAVSHCEMVVMRYKGKTTLTVRGPETRATSADCPADGEWFGVIFKLGTFMPHLPASQLVDRAVDLPDATRKSFWLNGSAWQFPDYEHADTFVARLVRKGLLAHDSVVADALRHHRQALSPRTVQRHFLRATGLTRASIRQIERARWATMLLEGGVSIPDVIECTGYADQPHLTRSLKRLVGRTPAEILHARNPEQMSFLYKTDNPP